ncbi:MAG TPA: ATP-binding cassette domain-containing protein [Thermoanaerobaculia bacterium]|nr:ATP-binding cassette domain-containing protein [Thermoanaerobaculia bacterium]
MIEAVDLSRRYGDFTAVDDVSFAVHEGEIVGMLGPNGAGKTTTLRMITGFLPPTSGRVTVAGLDLVEKPREARRELGYLPENVALYPEMRVDEYLAYRARLEGLRGPAVREALDAAVGQCLIDDVRHQIIGTLSKGYRQRVALATAILHRPSVLVLDEPTVGLDPKQIIAIRELIRALRQERTVLLSTHILPEVELLCDRVLIIDRGRIIAQGTPQELRERSLGKAAVRVGFAGPAEGAEEALGALAGIGAVRPLGASEGRPEAAGDRFLLEREDGADPRPEVFRLAVARGWVLVELAEERATLEDIFVRLTTQDVASDAPPPAAAEPPGLDGAPPAGGDEEAPS